MAEYADDQYAHGQQYTDDQAYPTQEFAPQDKSDAQTHKQQSDTARAPCKAEREEEMDADSGMRGTVPGAAVTSFSHRVGTNCFTADRVARRLRLTHFVRVRAPALLRSSYVRSCVCVCVCVVAVLSPPRSPKTS